MKFQCSNEQTLTPAQLEVLCNEAFTNKTFAKCNKKFEEEMRYATLDLSKIDIYKAS